jgi:Interleukin-like EMT inducer
MKICEQFLLASFGYKHVLFSTECLLEAVSWGTFATSTYYAYIAINGNIVSYIYSGFTLVELNVSSCSSSNIRYFYISNTNNDSYNMAIYINSLPLNTVLIGATGYDVQQYLTQNAKSALVAIGVNVKELQYGGKVSFVSQIGQPAKTISKVATPGGNNLKIMVNVTGRTTL